ncbi:MAG: DEAD/DEAH box helicase [Chloracidobacterium sp.]|nr:DEAD/DEAH box helicase [Chloracidobacterium sp.]
MTPTEIALSHYTLPFNLKPFQVEVVDDLGPLDNEGHYLDPGTGKTACSTVVALFRKLYYDERCVVIMPPILLKQWESWLKTIKPSLSVVKYAGTPAERKAMNLDADFVLVGIQIFKKEYMRFENHFRDLKYVTIVDEATMISNIGTDNHERLMDFTLGKARLMLTGTPLNNPEDAYGLLKFVAPGVYRNKTQFMRVHSFSQDFFGKTVEWGNLELLAENMSLNSKRVLLADVYEQMPEVSYIPLNYDLDPKHLKLYRKLAEEELLRLPDGGKIDATQATRLVHALGQIVINWGHFAGDPKLESETVTLVKEKLDELGDGKLLIFAHYRMSVALLASALAKYGVVTVNSEVTAKQKQVNLERFVNDPKCRVMVAQVKSAGYGLDSLQTVCNHAMYVEPCTSPRDFTQSVARLVRMGQDKPVQVYMAIASGTLQPRSFNSLLEKDEVVNQVIRNVADLRDMIFGG